LTLTDHQDFNRFINHEAITGSVFLGTNIHKDMSGVGGTSTTSNVASGVSGYWPWGDYLHYQQLQDFDTVYSLPGINKTSNSNQYGVDQLYNFSNNGEFYSSTFKTPFFTHGPLTFVMRPVARYGVDNSMINWSAFGPYVYQDQGTAGNVGSNSAVGTYSPHYNLYATELNTSYVSNTASSSNDINERAQYFNATHFYAPNQNSNAGSYLTMDEMVTTRGFANASSSVFWGPWDMRGASCFLSTNTGTVQPFGSTGIAFDRSAGEDFYELPLRKAEYNTAQSGDSRTLTKFCFYDNAVGNTVENGSAVHPAWSTIGVGATTDWSINPISMSGAARDNGYVYRLETPREKDNDHILKVSFKYTWTRNTGQL
jgi:hypothetical protein